MPAHANPYLIDDETFLIKHFGVEPPERFEQYRQKYYAGKESQGRHGPLDLSKINCIENMEGEAIDLQMYAGMAKEKAHIALFLVAAGRSDEVCEEI